MMRRFPAAVFAILLALGFVLEARAQAPESIWLAATGTSFKPGETVAVTVNAVSATAIQGFNVQIRYDPACLQAVEVTTSVAGMNRLSLPQTAGLVDATFASTSPQTASGPLAEVRFSALAECQTTLTLESAALAIKNESGYAVPLAGVTVGEKTVAISIGKGEAGTAVPVGEAAPAGGFSLPVWAIVLLGILGVFILFAAFKLVQSVAKGEKPRR